MAAGITRGDIRHYRFAPPDKLRPVVVLTRQSAVLYLATVTVAPLTSTIRDVPSELVLTEEDGMKAPCAVNLHNLVTVSQERLGRRLAQLTSARMGEICSRLLFALGVMAKWRSFRTVPRTIYFDYMGIQMADCK